jgi:hypothetical protein
MRRSKITACAMLVFGLAIFDAQRASGQSNQPTDPESSLTTTSPAVVRGQSFSATKYVRKVKTLPDGKQQFIRNEIYPVQVARDSDGRIRVQVVGDHLQPECDQPASQVPPPCPSWNVILFDPVTQTITHWAEGEMGGHAAIVVKLSAPQVEDIENSTSVLREVAKKAQPEGPTVTTEDLGEKVVEGVSATGVRTTTVFPVGYSGNKTPITTIREVWTSTEMKLVIKIIDGDPRKEETLRGLEHVSLQPDPSLFRPPDGYEIQYGSDSKNADEDVRQLDDWLVKES